MEIFEKLTIIPILEVHEVSLQQLLHGGIHFSTSIITNRFYVITPCPLRVENITKRLFLTFGQEQAYNQGGYSVQQDDISLILSSNTGLFSVERYPCMANFFL